MNEQRKSVRAISIGALIVIVFLGLRIALLWARDPFFDELFTLWIAQKPFAAILAALRHDSGPPLYYFIVHALSLHSIDAIRVVSLVASCVTLAIVLTARQFGNARFIAAALLAVYPPAVLFAIDARAYALCAMFVAAGIVMLWSDRPFVAAALFVLAAYSHYYGALFFPLLLMPLVIPSVSEGSGKVGGARTEVDDTRAALPPRSLAHARDDNAHARDDNAHARDDNAFNFQFSIFNFRSLGAFAAAVIVFLPGLWLALHQPRESMQWLHEARIAWIQNLSFAGRYPYALFAPAQRWLVAIAAMLLVLAIAGPALIREGRRRAAAFAAMATLIPLATAVLAGVYFPMRFESVIAVPLAVWIAVSVESWDRITRRVVIGAFVLIGLVVCAAGIVDHANRPIDPYRAAAIWTAGHVRPGEVVVASGYCYLEAVTFVHARVIAMPPEQALHPGWRAFPAAKTPVPPGPFLWIGERFAPELSILRNARSIKPLYANDRAIVAAVR